MKERNHDFTPFNHGYLCQMLHSANDNELDNIINDVRKEKERRIEAKKNEYIKKIQDAIDEATDAGYVISFYRTSFEEHADYTIDENDACLLSIGLD